MNKEASEWVRQSESERKEGIKNQLADIGIPNAFQIYSAITIAAHLFFFRLPPLLPTQSLSTLYLNKNDFVVKKRERERERQGNYSLVLMTPAVCNFFDLCMLSSVTYSMKPTVRSNVKCRLSIKPVMYRHGIAIREGGGVVRKPDNACKLPCSMQIPTGWCYKKWCHRPKW